jgi:transposase/tetratricopeptide (TPR) repeat protein
MTTLPEIRKKSVETYIKSGESLRRTSEKLGIPHLTLWRWVNWYKEGGKKNLVRKRPYSRPWNRPSKELEEKVMLLKERTPALTLQRAQDVLAKEGIMMSLKGIWGIWKRFALAGREYRIHYEPFGPVTSEIRSSLKEIRKLLKKGMVKEASSIANSLPSFPKDSVLKEIPEKLLKPRRQLDLLSFAFGEIPFPEYYRKANKVRKALEKRSLFYSSIFAGLKEFLALNWMGTPTKGIELLIVLKERAKDIHDPSIRFLLSMHEAKLSAYSLNSKGALESFRECKKLHRTLKSAFYYDSMGNLSTNIWNFRNASLYFQKAIDRATNEDDRKTLRLKLATIHAVDGSYRKSRHLLRDAEREIEGQDSIFAIIRAYCAFAQADISKSSSCFRIALEKSKKGQLRNLLHAASFGLAGIQAALGNEKKAKAMLRKYLPLFRKYKMETETVIRNIILGDRILDNDQIRGFPVFHLLLLLQNSHKPHEYKTALRFARSNGLLGFLHRNIVFFPEPILAMLEKGKDTELPRAILNLPVFRKEIPSYYVKFLGPIIVHKNQKYLKMKLTPKDTSILIFLASSEGKSISLDKIYKNFWPKSGNPPRNLAHLLVRLRKSLRLPSHFLYVKENKLIYNCYFTSDYDEYQEHLAQAKVLLRAGEWEFAKQEFHQAFKLFRREPFRKMYDDWSDDKRLEILFSYETEVVSFSKELIKRGREEEAHKLLKNAEKVQKSRVKI